MSEQLELLTECSLVCTGCDAGQGVLSVEETVAAGWTTIDADDTIGSDEELWWTHTGRCPECSVKT